MYWLTYFFLRIKIKHCNRNIDKLCDRFPHFKTCIRHHFLPTSYTTQACFHSRNRSWISREKEAKYASTVNWTDKLMQAKRWQKSQKCLDWRKWHHISHCPSKHKSPLVFHILLYTQLCGVLPLTPTVQQITEEVLQDFRHFPTLLSGHKSKIHTTLSICSGEVPLFGISTDIILSKNYSVCKQPDLSSTLNFHYLTDLHINKPSGNSPAFWCTHYILLFTGSRGLW